MMKPNLKLAALYLFVSITAACTGQGAETPDPDPNPNNDSNLDQPKVDDTQAPTLSLTVPANGDTVSALSTMTLTFDEGVVGADNRDNYTISGNGAGTLHLDSVLKQSDTEYQLIFSGLVNNGTITITYSNITDAAGNKLTTAATSIFGNRAD